MLDIIHEQCLYISGVVIDSILTTPSIPCRQLGPQRSPHEPATGLDKLGCPGWDSGPAKHGTTQHAGRPAIAMDDSCSRSASLISIIVLSCRPTDDGWSVTLIISKDASSSDSWVPSPAAVPTSSIGWPSCAGAAWAAKDPLLPPVPLQMALKGPPLAWCASSFRHFCKPFGQFWVLGPGHACQRSLFFFSLSFHPISERSSLLIFPVFLLTKPSNGHHPASHSFSTPKIYRISVTFAVSAAVRILYTRSDPTLARVHRITDSFFYL